MDIAEIEKRHKDRLKKNIMIDNSSSDSNKLSKSFSKLLLSIILILSCSIYIHLEPDNLSKFKSKIFETNLTFAKINNLYNKYFGSIMPTISNYGDTLVSNELSVSLTREEYLDGYKITTDTDMLEAKTSGILVYLNDKEGYGKTAIIQGIDGVDIWYGNLDNVSLHLYDYVEKGSIIGSIKNNTYYNVYMKDGQRLSYEEYNKEV